MLLLTVAVIFVLLILLSMPIVFSLAVAGVAGAYLVDNRLSYSIGIRGLQIPGDFNTRILVLVDGASINETWGAFAGIGFDAIVSIDEIARIEVIRGPVSSVYGTNAFFGIINIVTRGAAEAPRAWGRASVNSINGVISGAGCLYARTLLGVGVRDLTGGYKCFRRAVLEAIELDEVDAQGYQFQIEMTYRALLLGFRVVEVPITFADRLAGGSKMSRSIVLEAIRRVPLLRLQALRGRLPRSAGVTSLDGC